MKRVREVFEEEITFHGIIQVVCLSHNFTTDCPFQVGEVVRVTVERLPAKRKGKRP